MVMSPTPAQQCGDDFRELLEASYRQNALVHLTAGSRVPLLKHNFWLVVRGMVRLGAITIHGDETLLGLAGPNEPFGDPLSAVLAYQATTLVDTDLLCLPANELRRQPRLASAMLEAVVQRYRQSQSLLALMALRRVEERVRGFLEMLVSDYGHPCDQGLRLHVRLTHQDIANAVGTTRVTVTRVIGQLRQEGWLTFDAERHLVVSHLPTR